MSELVTWSGLVPEFTWCAIDESPGAVVRAYLSKVAIDVPADAWLVLEDIRPDGLMLVHFCWLGYSGVVRQSPTVYLRRYA